VAPVNRPAVGEHARDGTADEPPHTLPGRRPPALPAALAAATVLAQVVYPLAPDRALAALTITTVLLFCGASVTHVAATRGWAAAGRFLIVAAGVGLLAESLGVHTGVPFGSYDYTDRLGAQLWGVPAVVPLAWAMMAWPALVVGRALGAPALLGGLALASWDLFLDPQMVDAGFWIWHRSGPALNGIPLVNTLGWAVVGVALVGGLDRLLPRRPSAYDDALPLALWAWTYASSVLANLAFFSRPGVALVGGLGMGAVAALLARRLLSGAPAAGW